ncbi:Protein LURP-one-related 11 [Striga hermonthica]|uniref:Protein LURP-one-related 11 n=1 Tax=Striga hermonthica TaxID=68872 RepID=A0A9N7P2J9_STRHE|nr:Protein LURP-one-related 11 [Striga hermonthica]
MKSLVFHGNGCTVFNTKGDVVYRVDNYQKRCGSRVFLMDANGKVLYSINKKKMHISGCWEGYKWNGNSKDNDGRPWFQVRRNSAILSKDMSYKVAFKCREENDEYKIIGSIQGKSALKIVDSSCHLLAEAVQKQSLMGVSLGEDVLRLTVEPQADQSLVMALVTVYSMINNKL